MREVWEGGYINCGVVVFCTDQIIENEEENDPECELGQVELGWFR